MKQTHLPPSLQAAWEEIEVYSKDYGLDFFPIIFEVLDYKTLYEIAALGGFPIRYPHWRFGMEYNQLSKGYTYGLSVIYEMVINTDPSYAYLLEGNEMVTQKMVMAHVAAHVDFFKNNMWFAPTNRKMLDEMANHATRIQRLINRHGQEAVEDFVDVCLSLDNLIDYHAPYIRRPESRTEIPVGQREDDPATVEGLKVERPDSSWVPPAGCPPPDQVLPSPAMRDPPTTGLLSPFNFHLSTRQPRTPLAVDTSWRIKLPWPCIRTVTFPA